MTRSTRPFKAADILSVGSEGGHLCLELQWGKVPLYYFAPLRLARAYGQSVPFAADWPEHLKPFVYAYAPLPVLPLACIPAHWQAEFASQQRDLQGLRPQPQATFRGWPLYVYLHDEPGQPGKGSLDSLFCSVPLDLLPLSPGATLLSGP